MCNNKKQASEFICCWLLYITYSKYVYMNEWSSKNIISLCHLQNLHTYYIIWPIDGLICDVYKLNSNFGIDIVLIVCASVYRSMTYAKLKLEHNNSHQTGSETFFSTLVHINYQLRLFLVVCSTLLFIALPYFTTHFQSHLSVTFYVPTVMPDTIPSVLDILKWLFDGKT